MKHRIGLTVTDPNHPMVSKRKETIQKTIRVPGEDREKAINTAIAHYRRKGYKVHDHHYIGTVNEEVEQIDEIGDTSKGQKLLQMVNKRAVSRVVSKRADTDPAYAKKAQQTHLAADARLKEETSAYEKSEENKRSADAAKKQGDMFAHHLHMADYHDNLAQWHAEKGRHSVADSHAAKSDEHHKQAMKLKEEVEQVDEISRELTHDYFKKAYAQKYKNEPTQPTKLQMKNRNKGMSRAASRLMQRLELPKGVDPSEGGKYTRDSVEYNDDVIVEKYTENDISNGGTVIYKHEGKHYMSKVSHKTGSGAGTKIHTTSALGHVVPLHHVVSTDSSDWNIYKNRPVKEEVEQVDELRTSTLLRYAIKANNSLIGGDRSKEEKRIKSIQKANYKIQTRHKVKEDVEQQDEAWTQGNRNPQRGVKVGDKVRSYDFPGMHDDHYIEGHVVADNPHTYHIRVNKVVRSGKEIPVPAHMQHVEAPKGKGMFSNAYAVHKMMAKQQSVTPAPEPAKGADKTFRGMRDRLREGAGPWGKISASALEKIKKAQEKERRLAARNPGALTKTAAPSRKKADKKYYDYLAKEKP